jgi:hypothetical protein
MLDFRVVIAACIAGVVILLGGIGLVASFKIAHEPVRPANRIVERPRIKPNASLPMIIETPATKPAPAREAVRVPEPAPILAPIPAPVPVATPEPEPAAVAPPVEAHAPVPAQPAPVEITGTIAPRPAPVSPAPAVPAALAPAATEPVENPAAAANLPVRAKSALPARAKTAAKKTPQRRPAATRPAEPQNPFSAIFGGFTNQ